MLVDTPNADVHRLIGDNFTALASVKRFFERWRADMRFRDAFDTDPAHALAEAGIALEPEDVSPLLGSVDAARPGSLGETIQVLAGALSSEPTATESLDARLDRAFPNGAFDAWRRRQIGRLRSQQILRGYDDIGHLPAAFELTDGCSVGCWFCSLAPEKLSQVFRYTKAHASLWRDLLTRLQTRIGPGVRESFCYWATDPFDNPDYEQFLYDFHDVFGTLPRTTTAQAWRYPDRARELLRRTEILGGGVRFSVLSIGMLNRIHKAFSAVELANVNLVMQMDGAIGSPKARAGAARTHAKAEREPLSDEYAPSTVTGFVVNLATGSVELVSPCLPSDRWPKGHRVHARGRFTTAEDFESLIGTLIDDHMPIGLKEADACGFRPDLTFASDGEGFRLATRVKSFTFQHPTFPTRTLGQLIAEGNWRVGEIVETMVAQGQPETEVIRHLATLFDAGFLDDGL